MFFIAWKHLTEQPARLTLTLVGLTFAVALMFFDIAAYLGFVRASTVLIDHANADIWVTLANNVNFDSSRPFPERKLWKVRQARGIAWAEPVFKAWALMKLKNGATDTVMIVGFDPQGRIGWPWSLKEGTAAALKVDETIILDESTLPRLGGVKVGDELEISDTQVRVVGISRGARTFTTYPVAFTNYQSAKRLSVTQRSTARDQTTFILAKVAPGYRTSEVIERLKTIGGVDVYARDAFAWNTRRYWIVHTGMGVGFGIVALLGLLVGTVIVGQTIYTSTLDHLREYGTLKALGAGNRELMGIILWQALVHAAAGYGAALVLVLLGRRLYDRLGLTLVLTGVLPPAMLALTVLMCVGASILAIRKVFTVDPTSVFRA
jgi:putative ABC transport system permease protein